MTQIILSSDVAGQLQNLGQPAELCDPSGRVIGRFVPPVIDLSKWEPVGPEISEEELHRRFEANEKRYTTAEVIAYLESL